MPRNDMSAGPHDGPAQFSPTPTATRSSAPAAPRTLEIFRPNVEAYPGAANVYDNLAETYLGLKDEGRAAENYRKALELSPADDRVAGLRILLGRASAYDGEQAAWNAHVAQDKKNRGTRLRHPARRSVPHRRLLHNVRPKCNRFFTCEEVTLDRRSRMRRVSGPSIAPWRVVRQWRSHDPLPPRKPA